MRQARRRMDSSVVIAASERIQNAVCALPGFVAAKGVGCYLALPYEVQTRQIIDNGWRALKQIAAPAWNEKTNRYELTWMGPDDQMRTGRWSIREPASTQRAGLMDLDLLIVPALAYDRHGGRLGHGGGHYDSLLGSWGGLKIGVAFEFQMRDRVPMGSQDIPVDLVVTEHAIYSEKGERLLSDPP